MVTEPPTREQLLALEPGATLRHGDFRAYRTEDDPRYPAPARQVHITKRLLDGELTSTIADDMIRDMAADPWRFMTERLDATEAENAERDRARLMAEAHAAAEAVWMHGTAPDA